MEEEADEPGAQLPPHLALQVDAILLSLWRRILNEGVGSELTLPEAATLLEASLDTLRRHNGDGNIHAFHDDRGRIRISTSVTYTPEGAVTEDQADAEALGLMWSELKSAREQLAASQAEAARLQAELEATEKALQYTKSEVGTLWRAMTTGNLKQAARRAAHESHEAAKIVSLAEQRARIRSKVADVRDLARRRKWPWSLVG